MDPLLGKLFRVFDTAGRGFSHQDFAVMHSQGACACGGGPDLEGVDVVLAGQPIFGGCAAQLSSVGRVLGPDRALRHIDRFGPRVVIHRLLGFEEQYFAREAIQSLHALFGVVDDFYWLAMESAPIVDEVPGGDRVCPVVEDRLAQPHPQMNVVGGVIGCGGRSHGDYR
ncbi:hypothetical protein [Nocardia terpenica]|uniref:hypothetical protein n=1 Tax=Nocardia terpenica TaxID=455432 RepID=UPI0012E96FCD|nr:hypothetical protein [Nocardia terpenica]NQE88689.1 hypothetical protein [Nocardia terpenica]